MRKVTVSMRKIVISIRRNVQGKLAVEKDDQFLLYVAGEGGTGKSWVIEAVRLGMKLFITFAPSGSHVVAWGRFAATMPPVTFT